MNLPRELKVGKVLEHQRLSWPTIRVRGHFNIITCCPHEASVLCDQPARFDPMRFVLPYGVWTCADGREVLFNREYRAIWERLPDGSVREADPDKWVPFKTQLLYFQDGNPPWFDRKSHQFCEDILSSWDLPERIALYPDQILKHMGWQTHQQIYGTFISVENQHE